MRQSLDANDDRRIREFLQRIEFPEPGELRYTGFSEGQARRIIKKLVMIVDRTPKRGMYGR